jgi:hypothetical protein
VSELVSEWQEAAMQSSEAVNCRKGGDLPSPLPPSQPSDRQRRPDQSDCGELTRIRYKRALCRRSRVRVSTTVPARSVFDSWVAPLSTGVRSVTPGPRRLVYWAGDYQIDLLLEPRPDTNELSLTGQVLNTAGGGGKPAKATVALLTGGSVQTETQMNQLGEFHLDGRVDPGSELRIKLPRMKVVSILLE